MKTQTDTAGNGANSIGKNTITVLLLGNGSRECALAEKFHGSPLLKKLYISPGNAGTAAFGENTPLDISSPEAVGTFCNSHRVDLLVSGPELPLVLGVADAVKALSPHTHVFGPERTGAHLEGSKAFAKGFMTRHAIPTAPFTVASKGENPECAIPDATELPIVLKADGLAAGKGTLIASTVADARRMLHVMLNGAFGKSSERVVIEKFMNGQECSVFVMTDGTDFRIFPVACDYKRAYDRNTGPNTGGMGAVCPVDFADQAFMRKVCDKIIEPTLRGLREEGIEYRGIIYLGLINVGGEPYVLEYNVRMGDPETAPVLAMTKTDILDAFLKTARGRCHEVIMECCTGKAVGVVVASSDYPAQAVTGKGITIDRLPDGVEIHAGGMIRNDTGELVTSSGRVCTVVGKGPTLTQARLKAYEGVHAIHFDGAWFRTDIAE